MSAPHPDDEQLSAALDGHHGEALAHAEGCATCTARLAELRAVAALVGAPVPTPPADAAVAAALRAAAVTPLRPRSRRGPFALAAAALVLVVLAALSVITRDDHHRDTMAADTGAGSAAMEGAVADELGDQSDPTALAERLRGVVEAPVVADNAQATRNSGEGGASAGSAPVAAPERRALQAGDGAGTPCEPTVAQEYNAGLGPLVYTASLRWEGTPAVALVYRIEGAAGSLDHRVLVMARPDCRLLVAQTF